MKNPLFLYLISKSIKYATHFLTNFFIFLNNEFRINLIPMSTKVTKTVFIAQVADKAGVSQASTEKMLNSMIDVIETNLKKDMPVAITGFGTFKRTTRKARKGINPKTQEKMMIPASISVNFKAGKTLKEAVSAKKK